ncbi:MAG: hypothetical protein ACLVA2_04120 [Clostridia bacterium]
MKENNKLIRTINYKIIVNLKLNNKSKINSKCKLQINNKFI